MVTETTQDKDFEWFLRNYSELFKQYGKKYLVIKNATVLGTYDTPGEAVRKTSQTEELGTFIVQFCNGDESGYTNHITSMNFMGTIG